MFTFFVIQFDGHHLILCIKEKHKNLFFCLPADFYEGFENFKNYFLTCLTVSIKVIIGSNLL